MTAEDVHLEASYQDRPQEPPPSPVPPEVYCEAGRCVPIGENILVEGRRAFPGYTLGAGDTTRAHSFKQAGVFGDLAAAAGVGVTVNAAMRKVTGGRFGLRETGALAAQVAVTIVVIALVPAAAPAFAVVAAGAFAGGAGYVLGARIAKEDVTISGVIVSAVGGALGAFGPALVAASARSAATPLTAFVRRTFEVSWGLETELSTSAALIPAQ